MPRINNLRELKKKLKQLENKYGKEKKPCAVTGYTQHYAIYVHEDLTAHHEVGMAKYLETPAKLESDKIARIVVNNVKKGVELENALVLGALYLQRISQQLVPVRYGALRASAFTAKERDMNKESTRAFEESERIRLSRQGSKKKKRTRRRKR